MHLILLPGNNKTNKDWIEAVADQLSTLFTTTYTQYYNHWKDPQQKTINIDNELSKLKDEVKSVQDKIVIFAKSVGTIVTLHAIKRKILVPCRCIFVGSPFLHRPIEELQKSFAGVTIPFLFIQQEHDPYGSFENLKQLLRQMPSLNYTLKMMAGNDHRYEDVRLIKAIVTEWLND
jgi:predicted alpha/beta hydrolase family esterase